MASDMRRKGISPVIATVIIVAVAIAIAIAVAFWMTGIVGLFTNFEQVQIASAYATVSGTNFVINMQVKNTGTAPAAIDNVFLNNVPFDGSTITITINGTTFNPGDTYSLPPGTNAQIQITFAVGATWPPGSGSKLTHGSSVEVKIHTASGKEYPKLVVLP